MSTVSTQRIEIIDALRGFALAGIVICHMVENYIAAMAPVHFYEAVSIGPADQIVDAFIGIFLRGKFIALFSFLFGLSFFIQMDNGEKRGIAFGGRFLWRLIILLVIGYVHSLFYRGDILTVYAMLGLFLIPFYKLDNKWVLGFAALLFLGLGRYLVFSFFQGDHLFSDVDPMNQEAPQIAEYYHTLKNGSIWEVFATNGWEGHVDKMNVQFGIFGRGYFTFAFFLIGLYVGRSGFFKRFRDEKKLTKKALIGSLVLFVVSLGITAGAFISLGPEVKMDNWVAMIGLSGMDMTNFAMTILYIALFTMLYRRVRPERWLRQFAPYGRMALTNYFLQSVLGTFLLFGWGLGYLGELRNIYTFLIALAIIILQMWTSKLWLRYFYYGPLEWLWRSLTFFKRFPFGKANAVAPEP
ncbi:DUF418 domain-containing protein [Flavobacteriaceae bacterium TP-CH-4]|uniref:DUF418 domain-containing protein n=1 Tax=Pelagihabitans pacificus TaxID=2696054 RepID=A0A967AVH7_9FLAO|nr:DUF418 domain-containing protein [Pelagihabitans pacificus]NHF60140.1 DUF418 domain-containing protein [Pelagihabitans pacificus]